MDMELVLIFGFVLTLLMIVLTFGSIAGQRSRQHRIQKLELEARIEEAKAAQASRPTANQQLLEDRLRVIERIVTDPSADLSRQIENLRDAREAREEAAS